MNSSAGPDTRPSTEATAGLFTRPGTVLPISRIGEERDGDDGSMSSTTRHNRLLIEAELRAEHQAAARTTMLDLAHALDASNSKSHELARLLRNEYETSAGLREERDKLQTTIDHLN